MKFICPFCKAVFNKYWGLLTHIRTVHPLVSTQCPVCGDYFLTKRGLISHISWQALNDIEHAALYLANLRGRKDSHRREVAQFFINFMKLLGDERYGSLH